ncbi:MAG: hypothetical protein AAF340_03870 [Pseudomonadota bacterium]
MNAALKYWRWKVLRQAPMGMIIAGTGIAATVFGAQLLPDHYTAKTRLLVEATSVTNTNRLTAESLHHAAQLQSIEARLMTQPKLAALAQELDSDTDPVDLQEAIKFDTSSGRGKPTTLEISVTDADGAFAAAAANSLAERVLSEHSQIKTGRAESALTFFREEVADQELRLERAFSDLLAFKQTHAGALPDDAPRYHDQRKALLLQRASKGLSVSTDPNRDRLESELRSASALYSNQHPRVRSLASQLDRTDPPIETTAPKLMNSSDITQIDAALALIPANTLRLEALENAHALALSQYEDAVARLEDAAVDERIALTAKGDRISVVEAALPPELPTGPRRKIFLALGVVLSCMLGCAFAILRARADQVLRRPQDLINSLQIKPYAVIPLPRPT